MSRVLVTQLRVPFDQAFGLLLQFMDICPDDLWAEKNGGWPVWQQVFHLLNGMAAFTENPEPAPALPAEYAVDLPTGLLQKQATGLCPKNVMREFAQKCKTRADGYIQSLDDTTVMEKNATISKLFGIDFNHLSTITLLATHTMYHLGGFDAALRNRGLKGVM